MFGSHDRAPSVSKRGGARCVNRGLPGFRCDGRAARESPHPHKGRGIEGWPPSNGGEKGPLQEMICAFFTTSVFQHLPAQHVQVPKLRYRTPNGTSTGRAARRRSDRRAHSVVHGDCGMQRTLRHHTHVGTAARMRPGASACVHASAHTGLATIEIACCRALRATWRACRFRAARLAAAAAHPRLPADRACPAG